jgi:hypothetical protein
VPITVDDGLVLRVDVFRPLTESQHPIILTYGPYAKGLACSQAGQRLAEDVQPFNRWDCIENSNFFEIANILIRIG